jgi:adenylate cyclase
MPQPGRDQIQLRELLHQYNEFPERRAQIAEEIDSRFRRSLAILVIDSSGFTRTVHEAGIIHFLAGLERLSRFIVPNIERAGGRFLKRDADNFFASFDEVTAALHCAIEIMHGIDAANEALPASDEMYVAMGVGYGSVLALDDEELFGDEMNLACKLGEDLAERGEILLTAGAFANLSQPTADLEKTTFSISGMTLEAYRYSGR